jgi:hypothetical protein
MDKFRFIKLDFQKTITGKITFFSTNIPLTDNTGKISSVYSFNFREDPRKLNDIIIDIPNQTIKFSKNNINYISIDPNAPICEDNIISVVTLTEFIRGFGGLNVKGALSNKTLENNSFPIITCKNSSTDNVILIQPGDKNIIRQESQNCYIIEYKECDINKVVEKFILVILEKYMSYFREK